MNIHSMLKFDTMAVDVESIRQLPKVKFGGLA